MFSKMPPYLEMLLLAGDMLHPYQSEKNYGLLSG